VMAWTACGLLAIGCGSSSEKVDAPASGSDSGSGTGISYPGGHGIAYYKLNANPASTITTPAMTTQAGSTIVVSVGRGNAKLFALPTDNQSDSYALQGAVHPYTQYPESGTALYTFKPTKGGSVQVTTTTGKNGSGQSDEITIAAVEVAASGKIQDVQWTEVASAPLTSKKVTTDGPATLVAFWWGDGFPRTPQSAMPNNDFTPIDTNAEETDSFVQCAVAVKKVTQAGSYDVTWTATPAQGAQLWLIAVE